MAVAGIFHTGITVSDLDRSIAFYRDRLGSEFIAKFEPPGLALFRFGTTRILLERNAPLATLYFRVDDVAKAAEELRARGVVIDSGPSLIHVDDDGVFGAAHAEEWMAFFRDPDGNVLAVASQEMPPR